MGRERIHPVDRRVLLGGLAAVGMASVLAELVSYRLAAAVFGTGLALLVAVLAPATGALTGALLSARSASAGAPFAAAVAAGGTAAVAIALSWSSQHIARQDGEAEWLHVLAPLAAWALVGGGAGATVAWALRTGRSVLGRATFVEAAGGAAGCLLVPAAMQIGAPRALLVTGIVYALAGLAFARVGREANPRWPALATAPLALGALLAGDLGEPWLEVRIDHERRRSPISVAEWTSQGLVTVDKVRRGKASMRVDRGSPVDLLVDQSTKRTPTFALQDLSYLLKDRALGAALLIGFGTAREVRVALAYGHPHVDALELDAAAFKKVVVGAYAQHVSDLWERPGVVTFSAGDGRAQLAALPRRYDRIVVVGEPPFSQAALRLLPRHDRLHGVEAIKRYLGLLEGDDATLTLVARVRHLPDLVAAAQAALGGAAEQASRHLFACAEPGEDGPVALLVAATTLDAHRRNQLDKGCKKKRLTVASPPRDPGRAGRPPASSPDDRPPVTPIATAEPPSDDRPFFGVPPRPRELRAEARAALRALRPTAARPPRDVPADAGPSAVSMAEPSVVGIAGSATGIALLFVLLTLLVPIPGRPLASDKVGAGPPLGLRVSVPLFGAAVALALFSASDQLLRWLGDGGYAWSVVVPLGLVGLGTGRLLSETMGAARTRSSVLWLATAAAGLLVALSFVGPVLAGATEQPLTLRLGGSACALLLLGCLLGVPQVAAMLVAGRYTPGGVGWCAGAHAAGWVLGGALAQLLVHYFGVTRLYWLGALLLAVAAVLYETGARRHPSDGQRASCQAGSRAPAGGSSPSTPQGAEVEQP